jgi:hypothetical protein
LTAASPLRTCLHGQISNWEVKKKTKKNKKKKK